jgi:hypothetical protein
MRCFTLFPATSSRLCGGVGHGAADRGPQKLPGYGSDAACLAEDGLQGLQVAVLALQPEAGFAATAAKPL